MGNAHLGFIEPGPKIFSNVILFASGPIDPGASYLLPFQDPSNPLLPCKGHCLSYLVLYQNHVLIVCMIQDQLFHTYRPKVFTDN
jgi:hypothetical protein